MSSFVQSLDARIWAAIIAALASLLVAFISLLWGHKKSKQLEQLKADLAETRAEVDARREYEYEARKRVYEACGPLFFQLSEAAEDALHRILSIAQASRKGNLGHGHESWLDQRGSYRTSTYYNLLAPLAVYKMLRMRLTLVDLAVEPDIAWRFELVKRLFLSFTEHHEFACLEPPLKYEPDVSDWKVRRTQNEARYWQQGLAAGRLDTMAETLILREADSEPRIMSYGEFESTIWIGDTDMHSTFEPIFDIIAAFEPSSRPVLWRILIAQAHLCAALKSQGTPKVIALSPSLQEALAVRDWPEDSAFGDPFECARRYFENRVPSMDGLEDRATEEE